MLTYKELLGLTEEPSKRRILLFDGNCLAYRSFYAIRELSTNDGHPVNAVYGFWRILMKVLREFPSAYVTVAFDAGGKTFRHELYQAYKATRKETPDELRVQFPVIRRLLEQLGINVVMQRGVEADDILASIAYQATERALDVLIVSSDKDLVQLVNDKIAIVRPSARQTKDVGEILDREGAYARFEVPPEKIVDFLSLVGDTADNIPGIPSVGKKRASQLLGRFGSLDGIMEHLSEIKSARIRENLIQYADKALLARKLVTLKKDVEVGQIPEDCALQGINTDELVQLLTELEFRSVVSELGIKKRELTKQDRERKASYHTVLSRTELDRLVTKLAKQKMFSIDLETTSRDPMQAKIVGIAISPQPYEGYYVPVGHDYLGAPCQLACSEVLEALRGLIESTHPQIIGQNLKYDLIILYRYGLHPRGICFDTMLASHLAQPDERRHNLERIASSYLNYKMLSYAEVAGKDGSIAAVPIERSTFYAAEDAEIVFRLKAPLEKAMHKVQATKLFQEVELPLVSVLARMEQNGVLLDKGILAIQGEEIGKELATVKEDLYEIAGERFNPNSPKQVAEVLFDHLGLPVIERTKTGPSTSARVLVRLAMEHPLPGKLLTYRELEKLMTTYIRRLPAAVNPRTGRIHTSFHQTSTTTGRLSSSDPNLQNIPIRTKVGERIRRAFIAPKGSLLIGADYSQIELRLLAHLSEDKGLIAAFKHGEDLHRLTASRIFGITEEMVTYRLRNAAKRINFGILYGISPYGLARELSISQAEAKAYIDRFFTAYPEAKHWIDKMIKLAEEHGYTETILGRRRPLIHITSRDTARRNFDRRNAVNTPIQGSAADLIKLAMLRIDRLIEEDIVKAKMLLQVHDELIFEVEEEYCEQVMEQVKEEMEQVMELRLPLQVTVKCGTRWSDI